MGNCIEWWVTHGGKLIEILGKEHQGVQFCHWKGCSKKYNVYWVFIVRSDTLHRKDILDRGIVVMMTGNFEFVSDMAEKCSLNSFSNNYYWKSLEKIYHCQCLWGTDNGK